MKLSVLMVEDSPDFIQRFRENVAAHFAERAEFEIVEDIATARHRLTQRRPDLLLLDIVLPKEPGGKPDRRGGHLLLAQIPEIAPGLSVTMLSGQDRREAVALLLSRKVDGYLFKDYPDSELRAHLERTIEQAALRKENARLRAEGRTRVVGGAAPAFQDLLGKVARVAVADTTVLLQGESGTGKEVLARAIHEASPRAAGPFVPVSCGALPEALAEAELFGALKGAYTGLDADRAGAMATANGGTLFLDEVGELPPALQPKLLRALQERRYKPLGADEEVACDIRLVCATHRDLEEMAKAGTFRQDLLFRVAVFTLEVPPLRERLEDLPDLVEHLLSKLNQSMGRRIQGVSAAAMERLRAHPWPGNVRELANVLEYAFVLEGGDEIQPESLPRLSTLSETSTEVYDEPHLRPALEKFEAEFLRRALARNGHHLGRTAEALDVPRRTLQNRMAKLGIRVRE